MRIRKISRPVSVALGAISLLAVLILTGCASRPSGKSIERFRAASPSPTGPPTLVIAIGSIRGHKYPCGDPATLVQAQDDHQFTIYIPNHPLASETNLEGVSNCPDAVLLYFDSGVSLHIEAEPSPPADPAAFWQILADQELPGIASVGTVRGVPAEIIDPAARPPEAPVYLGVVSFYEDGVHLSVGGNGELPASELIAVAETLQPVSPTPTPSSTT